MKYILLALWLLHLAARSTATDFECPTCSTPYVAVGCYRDDQTRPLPNQILNERDPRSNVWDGYKIDWGNWDIFMPQMVCRCAYEAKEQEYQYFAIQFWGECWAGNDIDAAKAIPETGTDQDPDCFNSNFHKCDTTPLDCGQRERCDTTDRHCVGKTNVNFIYKVVDHQCGPDLEIERVGCFRDLHVEGSRPLPDYMYNERDTSVSNYGGRNIDWVNFDLYVPRLACHCAQIARDRNYKVFGLQYYGECWGGADLTYFQDGEGTCAGLCYGDCLRTDRYCVGTQRELFVYRIRNSASCARPHSAVGCVQDLSTISTELILTERDPLSDEFNGFDSTYVGWGSRPFSEFVCACSMRALERNYAYFGVTDDGECFGTDDDPSAALADISECNNVGSSDTVACADGDSVCGGLRSSETEAILSLFFYQEP